MTDLKKLGMFSAGLMISAYLFNLAENSPKASDFTQDVQIKVQQDINKKELKKMRELQQILISKSHDFELQWEPSNSECLTQSCLAAFVESTADFFDSEQVVQLYEENRRARRCVYSAISEKYETYFKFVCTFDESVKYLVEKAQKDFAVFLNVEFSAVMDSISIQMESSNSEHFREIFFSSVNKVRESLNNYLPLTAKPVSTDHLLKILDFELQHLVTKSQAILQIVADLGLKRPEEEESLPVFLNCYIADMVFQEFGVENEQLTILPDNLGPHIGHKYDELTAVKEQLILQMYKLLPPSYQGSDDEPRAN